MNKSEIEFKIKEYYLNYLERDPDEKGLTNALNKIVNKRITFEQLESSILKSDEYKRLQQKKNQINDLQLQIKKPIFIVGVARSGTGLLYHTLCAHPDLAWFNMNYLKNWVPTKKQEQLKKHYQKLQEKNEKFPADENALTIFGNKLFNPKDFEHLPVGPYPIEGEIFWQKFFGHGFVKDIKIDKKITLSEGILNATKKQKKPRFLSKAPQNIMRLYAIKKIFPDSIFINIARDPRSVVSSMIRRFNAEGSFNTGVPIQDEENYKKLGPVQKWAWQYKEITEILHEFSIDNSSQFKTIIYEDFLRNPLNNLKKIFNFSNLEIPKNFENKIPKITEVPNKKRFRNLDKEDEKKIFEIVHSCIKKMDYPYVI